MGLPAVHAQTAPDAGRLMQQNQPAKPAVLPKRSDAKELSAAPSTMNLPSGATVSVKRFVFKGNTLLDDATLQRTLTGYLDRKLDFKELQEAAAMVAKRYSASGRLARVFLPAQDVTEGVITLQVMEARYGGTQIEKSGPRLDGGVAKAMMDEGQVAGQALDLVALDRSLLLVSDLPGVKVSASLVPGRAPGETAVAVSLTDKPLVAGEIGVGRHPLHRRAAAERLGGGAKRVRPR